MDQEESWYVGDRQLKHQETPETISASSETELKAGSYTLTKQSDNVVKVNDGEFYLYRKAGATGVLTGMIGTGNDAAASARALGSIAGIKNIVRNLGNSSNTEEFTVQPNTPFETPPSIIPGDSYTVETQIMMTDGTVKDGPVVEVTPKTERDDLGTISLTDKPYNFKVMGRINSLSAYSYIGQSYLLDIQVKNIGTEDSYGTTYEFPPQESGVTITDDNVNRRLGTIEPGIEKNISVSVRFDTVGTGDYEDARVKVWIRDINNGVWEDSITLRFYRKSTTFNFASVDMPVYGVVLSPEKSGTYFGTRGGTGGLYTTSLVMPYRSNGYVVSLSRATANTETVYSIGVGVETAARTAMDSFNDTAIFEPNNEETLATDMAIGTSIISYIHKNDVDFFRLRSDAVIGLVSFSPAPGTYAGSQTVTMTTNTSGATIRYTTDGSTPTSTYGTVYSGALTVSATQTIKAIEYKAGMTNSGVASAMYVISAIGTTTSNPNIGTLINVPAGTFQRDSVSTNTSRVSAFRMSKREITRAQFSSILGTDPSSSTNSSGTSDPVQQVNWYHSIAFCNKLSIAEGLTPVYSVSGVTFATLTYASIPISTNSTWDAASANWSANGYRLPTEMEWMWAAMGATAGSTGYLKAFAGSTGTNAIDEYAWYSLNSSSNTHPVGTKLPNELGLYDMSGNVAEWIWDWYGAFPAGALTDYRGATTGSKRVLRGGCFASHASYATVALRTNNQALYDLNMNGFRVVRNP